MPEIINLLSSTPPRQADTHNHSSIRRFHSSPPAPPAPPDQPPIPLFSDGIDGWQPAYDGQDDFSKPSKRRRLTPELNAVAQSPTRNTTANPVPARNRDLFVFSDDILPSPAGAANRNAKNAAYALDSDPIVFTSSAPEPRRRSPSPPKPYNKQRGDTRASDVLIDDSSDLGIDFGIGRKDKRKQAWADNIEEFGDPLRIPDLNELLEFQDDFEEEKKVAVPALQSEFSGRTASLLASLLGESKSEGGGIGARTKKKKSSRLEDVEEDEDDPDEIPEPKGSRKPKKTTATARRSTVDKEAKAKDREEAKAQRDREKQIEKERKLKLKEEKAKEKQVSADIAQANKLKIDKKESTPEMVIDLSSSLNESSVATQALEHMRRLGVEHSFFDSPIPNVVKWRRKMKAKYIEALGYWQPCELHIREEEHVLCIVTAQEFVSMVTSSIDGHTPDAPTELEVHVLRLKSAYPNSTIIYLIEGLTAWMRKNTNSRNRAYQAEFRRNLGEVQASSSTDHPPSTASRPKKTTKETAPPIDDDTIEDGLLNLQVTHQCLIHQTAAPPESAEWIKTFTEHVSTVPYRRLRNQDNDSAFCMETGQVKAGENTADTYLKMLQEVNRITASMAYGIFNEYPSVVELVRAMRRSGPGLLEDVKKSANKNGALTDSRIGPAASRRLYKVFMSLDPQSTDI
ncbi:ERCC4 domain-containing protein [Aspergillus crustosus]